MRTERNSSMIKSFILLMLHVSYNLQFCVISVKGNFLLLLRIKQYCVANYHVRYKCGVTLVCWFMSSVSKISQRRIRERKPFYCFLLFVTFNYHQNTKS